MKREKLSHFDINMLKALMSSEVKLLRVFPYESQAINLIADSQGYSKCEIQEESALYKRLLDIRRYADKFSMNDNKIVIQVQVNTEYHWDCLFLGFWDHHYSVGTAVIPCAHAPKEFPKTPGAWNGMTVKF